MWWQRQRLFPSVSRVRYLNAVCSVSGCRWSPSVLVLYLLFVGLHGEIWYQKPWINFKSFYCFTCLVRHTKYRSFPYREPMWKEAKYSCTKQKEPGLFLFFSPTLMSQWFCHPCGKDGGTFKVPHRRPSSSALTTCAPGWSNWKWTPFFCWRGGQKPLFMMLNITYTCVQLAVFSRPAECTI